MPSTMAMAIMIMMVAPACHYRHPPFDRTIVEILIIGSIIHHVVLLLLGVVVRMIECMAILPAVVLLVETTTIV